MFGRSRSRYSRAASLARKRAFGNSRRNASKAPSVTTQTQQDKARAAFTAAQQKTAAAAPKATSKMGTTKQLRNSNTLTPPKGAMTFAREGRQAGIRGKAMGGYTERWAKARGKK